MARLEAGRAKVNSSASCRNRDDSWSALDLWSAYVPDFFLPSFILPSFARVLPSLCLPPTSFATDPTARSLSRSLARSLARTRDRVVRANRTSRTRRRGHGALCLSSARNLLRSLVNRMCPRRKKTELRRETVPGRTTRCDGTFPSRVRHVNSIYSVSYSHLCNFYFYFLYKTIHIYIKKIDWLANFIRNFLGDSRKGSHESR